jgi:steroid delta-isomerase-like uncharacterized protein
MSAADNEALVRRWIRAYNDRDAAGEEAARTLDFAAHVPGLPPFDNASWKQFVWGFAAAFPDLQLTVEDVVATADKVAARIRFRGTHRGDFMGIPATGREVTFASMEFNHVAGGRVAEHWVLIDMLGLLQQLGAASAPQGPAA